MDRDDVEIPADRFVGRSDSDLVSLLGDEYRAALRGSFFPGEYVVWAGRGHPPALPPIRFFPSFFAAFLCAASGFALMVLFGIFGLRRMELPEMLFFLGLPPAALGGVAFLGIATALVRHYLKRRRISRSFYVLTDCRAIVGLQGRGAGHITTADWTSDMFNGTLCIEGTDGIGDVYFTRNGQVVDPEWGFQGIEHPGRVDTLISEVLLGEKVHAGVDQSEL